MRNHWYLLPRGGRLIFGFIEPTTSFVIMSSNVSSELLWAITRNNSSYIVKRGPVKDQIILTREPLSLTNQHTYKVYIESSNPEKDERRRGLSATVC